MVNFGRCRPSWALPLLAGLSGLANLVSSSPLPYVGGARKFDLTITWEDHAPDGFTRKMALVNGQYPGPLLEINQGEDVEVHVQNNMPFNTTIHYHGIEQAGTPWSDGVPGLTQRLIQPGRSFTYKWKATQYGSYWYHAHERGQIDDGLYGPLLIHPSKAEPKPFSQISNDPATVQALEKAADKPRQLVVSDFQHLTSSKRWDITVASNVELACYDSILFNGKGQVHCPSREKINAETDDTQKQSLSQANETQLTNKACLPPTVAASLGDQPTDISAIPPEVYDVCTATKGSKEVIEVVGAKGAKETWVALDVIGTFGLITGSFSIDGLPAYVYAVDGSYVTPQLVEAITIANGDRYSILVKLTKPGEYTIRTASLSLVQNLVGFATLKYRVEGQYPASDCPTAYINDKGAATSDNVTLFNQAGQKNFPPVPIAQKADQTFKFDMRIAGAVYKWALNETVFPSSIDNGEPILFNPDRNEHNDFTLSTLNGSWVDLIFAAVAPGQPPHPIHKHGNKMFLIGSGEGDFPYNTVEEAVQAIPDSFNLVDPPRRDAFVTPPAITSTTWMVVRYHVTNPGPWLLHCHIQTHQLGGMSATIQDGIDHWPVVPAEYLAYQ